MPSIEYYEGRDMEKNEVLHKILTETFGFEEVDSDGASTTKTDIFGVKSGKKTFFSVKNVSGKNTQVHLTTLKKLGSDLAIHTDTLSKLEMWLGDNSDSTFNKWSEGKLLTTYEFDHNRLKNNNIDGWTSVETWINTVNQNQKLPRLLIQSLNDGDKSEYLVWVNKKTKKVKILKTEQLIDYISNQCKWITMKSGTTLRCVTPNNKPILWLQMKGNRTDDGYNHAPQFHIVENWPEDFVLHEFSV
jgi:hypothetical protein